MVTSRAEAALDRVLALNRYIYAAHPGDHEGWQTGLTKNGFRQNPEIHWKSIFGSRLPEPSPRQPI